ncbi:hypothetical protein DPF15_02165 [Salmonella enterica subsp. enterica serovar Lattenkamp]|uniref:Uncharacterized protein n=3 Tax=Salmonella enterica I TaxID=59201 RepID=A0A5W2LR82_SALET|nr:hypothetical protein [Salmonella enterica subsp. enterica serovar Lattenkamp]EBW4467764.1 hypothetical protein [Salmonella enterica subsp. enterica serovar Lattenkamp]
MFFDGLLSSRFRSEKRFAAATVIIICVKFFLYHKNSTFSLWAVVLHSDNVTLELIRKYGHEKSHSRVVA